MGTAMKVAALVRRVSSMALTLGKRVGSGTVRLLTSAQLWAFLLLTSGGALIVAAVDQLAGRGWAFLAAGMMLAYPGIVLVRGLARGG